jgi:hypothetical protein
MGVHIAAEHSRFLDCDELSRDRALVHVPEAAALVLRVVGQDDVFVEQGGREMVAAMCKLYDEVDGAAPARVCFRHKVQILTTIIIMRGTGKIKNAPFVTLPVYPLPAHRALRGGGPSLTPSRLCR